MGYHRWELYHKHRMWLSANQEKNKEKECSVNTFRQPPPADPPSSDSTDPKISAFSNVTFTTSRSSTVRTLDRRTSWAPRRNSKRPLLHPSRSLRYPPHHPIGSGWHLLQQSHDNHLILRELRNLLPNFMFILSITPNLSIFYADRRALSST